MGRFEVVENRRTGFNSMIVRLKVVVRINNKRHSRRFQFYDSPIKRCTDCQSSSEQPLCFNSMIVRLKVANREINEHRHNVSIL